MWTCQMLALPLRSVASPALPNSAPPQVCRTIPCTGHMVIPPPHHVRANQPAILMDHSLVPRCFLLFFLAAMFVLDIIFFLVITFERSHRPHSYICCRFVIKWCWYCSGWPTSWVKNTKPRRPLWQSQPRHSCLEPFNFHSGANFQPQLRRSHCSGGTLQLNSSCSKILQLFSCTTTTLHAVMQVCEISNHSKDVEPTVQKRKHSALCTKKSQNYNNNYSWVGRG